MKIGEAVDRWLGRFSNLWTFVGPVVPGTAGGLVTALLARSAARINAFGAFGWWCSFLVGALLSSLCYALFRIAKERKATADAINLWSKEVDGVNPLDEAFHAKRIKLVDIAHPVTRFIENKSFTNCELIGPINILIKNSVSMAHVDFLNCDFVPTKQPTFLFNTFVLDHVKIMNCEIARATIFLHPDALAVVEASGAQNYYAALTGNKDIDARPPPR